MSDFSASRSGKVLWHLIGAQMKVYSRKKELELRLNKCKQQTPIYGCPPSLTEARHKKRQKKINVKKMGETEGFSSFPSPAHDSFLGKTQKRIRSGRRHPRTRRRHHCTAGPPSPTLTSTLPFSLLRDPELGAGPARGGAHATSGPRRATAG